MNPVQRYIPDSDDSEDSGVEYTISQDQGAGNSARAEAGYVLLAGNDIERQLIAIAGFNGYSPSEEEIYFSNQRMKAIIGRKKTSKPETNPNRLFSDMDAASESFNGRERSRQTNKVYESDQTTAEEDESQDEAESQGEIEGEKGEVGDAERNQGGCLAEPKSGLYKRGDSDECKRNTGVAVLIRGEKETGKARLGLLGLKAPQAGTSSVAATHVQDVVRTAFSTSRKSTSGPEGDDASSDARYTLADGHQVPVDTQNHGEIFTTESNTKVPDHREYCVLYRVVCSDRNDRCHRRIYVDEPRRVLARSTYHLQGNELIPDLDDFLRDLPNIAFVVYRDYFCQKGTRSSLLGNSSKPGTKFFREIISVVSPELQSILQQNSMFAPDLEGYKVPPFDYMIENYESSPALSTAPSEYSNRFLFHHRAALNKSATGAIEGSQIKTLVSYMDSHPDPMYHKCDELFSRGMVTQETLPWLFRPNDVVISTEGPAPNAYVLRRVPVEGSTLRLECWNWGYDGQCLRRKDATLTVDIQSFGELKIDQLAVYPVQFAAQTTFDRISATGQKFWDLRHQVLVSYEGLDFQ
ncbi:hypothetical protein B0T21DRAFT_89077 [Apiosordaria backusii]|uniref:DUF7025 domain-containing protein n=1 Tax=Apiosordaria backusii TaxID=314023 RepID=A0AA40K3E6_9PEZI|nr:hypothetical protein B0T21DRAFT_89077 [Apiosordaria backusii]